MKRIEKSEKFDYCFNVKKSELEAIEKILTENNFDYTIENCVFKGFKKIVLNSFCIRLAYLVDMLIDNYRKSVSRNQFL